MVQEDNPAKRGESRRQAGNEAFLLLRVVNSNRDNSGLILRVEINRDGGHNETRGSLLDN